MERCVALLRGINVGGVTLTNTQLVSAFEQQHLTNVRAVLASGNIAFDVELECGDSDKILKLARTIEGELSRAFDYDAHLVLVTQKRLETIASEYPFGRDDALQHPYVIFSSSEDAVTKLRAAWMNMPQGADSVESGGGVIYWRVPKGSSTDSPFAKVLSQREYAAHLTTRNLRTVEKLVKA